jgi:acyl-CoA thioester hydrolase
MKHEYFFEVRGFELDSFGHVNNAVYLNYLEAARWKFFKETKWLDYMESQSLYPVVVETHIRYANELNVFDQAVIKSEFHYQDDYLIANQNIYLQSTHKKIAKATVKMILVSSERIAHELPEFIKNEMDQAQTREVSA